MAKAKLRKMLGSAEHPIVLEIKDVIATQAKETLAVWAADYAEEFFLPIYRKEFDDTRLAEALAAVRDCLAGKIKLKELKPFIKEAQNAAREASGAPAGQAAARAVSTAVGVLQTPTNSLGFTFYGAAAVAYDRLGLEVQQEHYDAAADEEFLKMLGALKKIAVQGEANPVKLKWNC